MGPIRRWGRFRGVPPRSAELFECVKGLVDNGIVNDPNECCLLLKSTKESPRNALPYVNALEAEGLIPYNPRNKAFFEQEETLGVLGALLAILDPHQNELPGRPLDIGNLVQASSDTYDDLSSTHPDLLQYVTDSRAAMAAATPGSFFGANLQEIYYYLISLPPFSNWQGDSIRRVRMARITNLLESYASMPVSGNAGVSRGTLRLSSAVPGEVINGYVNLPPFIAYLPEKG